MGFREDDLLDPNGVSDTLRCPVCFEVFDDPVFCGGRPCQHVFCRGCVERAIFQTAHQHVVMSGDGSEEEADDRIGQCPSCRAPMRLHSLQPHQVMRSLLDELPVRCRLACGWTGRRDARANHESSGPTQCPLLRLEAACEELALLSDAGGLLRDKDARIVMLEARVAEQDRQVVDVGRQLLAREVKVAELEARLLEQDRKLTQKDIELALLRRGRLAPAFSDSREGSDSDLPKASFLGDDDASEASKAGADLWL
ncbi:unnamed protein product [Polarella glacialis]|uniref:RING-type domain-containing protein n=1 Tax=Polarella glacialis TaxID=89957 RepID=A0A813EZY5_POLGL|nr:unnamed protein product [Polarella glacialis]